MLGATVFRPPATSGPFGRDFEAYYAAGATWNAGGDPYSRDVWRVERTIPGVDAAHDEVLPFIGPAASLPLWSLLARLPFGAARGVWLALLALALVVLAGAAAALAPGPMTLQRAAWALLFGALSGPLISDIALGQAALVAAAAVALALLALERRSAWAIPAAVVAALQPNLALPLVMRLTSRRSIALLAGAAAVFLALTLAAGGGPAGFAAYLHHLAEHGASERFILIQYGVPAIVASFHTGTRVATIAGDAATALALAGAVGAALALRAQPRLSATIAIAVLPFAVPFFHEHDFVIELIPAIGLAASPNGRVRTIAGIGSACALVDWLGVAQRPHAALQTACFALAVTCAFVALAQDTPRLPRPWLIPAVGAVLSALIIPLALRFPAPVWPDSLGAFHAAAQLDASAAWAAEQQHAGLTTLTPAWGVLRAIPLVGCALFAGAAVLAARSARYAMTMRPSRVVSATAVSESPSHGPATQ